MFKYFNEKAFKNIGILLTITSGISIFIGLFIMCTYSGNISHEEIRIHLMSDLKYLIIAIGIYLYNVIKLKITMSKSD